MKRLLVAGAVVALGISTALISATTQSASAHPQHKQFTVVFDEDGATLTPSNFFAAPAQNAQGSEDAPISRAGHPAGSALTVFTWVRAAAADPVLMIECSVELPEGAILFAGTVHAADIAGGVDVPVVGGTGSYSNAGGVVTLTHVAGSDPTGTFHLK